MSALANIVRPASWNAKMFLNGKPLITDAQFEQLLINGQDWKSGRGFRTTLTRYP